MPKDKELVSYSDHLFLIKKLEQINDTSPYNAINESENKDDNLQGVAIYLDNKSETIPIRLHVITGKSNKKSEKIVSSVQSVDDPSQINPLLRSIFLDYEKVKSLYNNQFPDSVHPKMLNLLAKHLDTMRQVPLYYMKEKFSFRRADMRNVEFSDTPAKVLIKARSNNAQYVMEGFILFGEEEVAIKSLVGDINSLLLFHNNQFFVIESLRASRLIQLLIERPILKYSIKSKESFNEQIGILSHVAKLEFKGEDIPIEELKIEPKEKSIELSESGETLIIQPYIKYEDEVKYRPGLDAENISGTEKLILIKRDQEIEQEFMEALSSFDSEFEGQKHLGFFYKHLDSVINTPWIFELYNSAKRTTP